MSTQPEPQAAPAAPPEPTIIDYRNEVVIMTEVNRLQAEELRIEKINCVRFRMTNDANFKLANQLGTENMTLKARIAELEGTLAKEKAITKIAESVPPVAPLVAVPPLQSPAEDHDSPPALSESEVSS